MGRTDVYLVDPKRFPGDRALLAEDERAYLDRCRHPRRQREFLTARSLLRLALTRAVPEVAPKDWRLATGEWGRPELARDAGPEDLRFNVTHTQGLVAVIVARGHEVGVDVEDLRRAGRTVELADRWFTPEEVAWIHAAAPESKRDRFFDLWTLKESYIKARGMGLAIPLHRVRFEVGETIGVHLDASLGDAADRWRFQLMDPTPRHRLAICVEGEVEVRVETWDESDPAET